MAASSSQINLSWNASTGNVSGYKIFRAGSQIATTASVSYTDTGLSPSTTYSYTVAAYDAAGSTSAQSASASATTSASSGGGGIPSSLGWYQVPNTSIAGIVPTYSDVQGQTGPVAVMAAWGGGMSDSKRNRLIIKGGGHNDWYGNELYAIDLNANPVVPVLVHDASHGSAISNLSSCTDVLTDGNPDARHTFNGLIYEPTQDKYFFFGAYLSPCGNTGNGQWQYDPVANSWTALNPSPRPTADVTGSVPQFAYDSSTDTIWDLEGNAPALWQYNIAANTWKNVAAPWGFCGSTNSTVVIDPGRHLFFCMGAGIFHKISLNSPYTGTDISSASGCSALVSANAPGFAYDPVQKLLVGWVSGNTVYTYNPDTNVCTAINTYTGGPTTVQPNGTFGRFSYLPSLGVFVVINDISHNAYTLRLTNSASSALQDFQTRCAQPGVIVCQGFDNASAFTPGNWPASGLYPSDTNTYATMDTSVYASGGGSLKFTIPSLASSNPDGYWRQLFQSSLSAGPGTAQVFAQNSTFYVQYRQRFSPEFVTNVASASGGTTWKQSIISNDQSTCGNEELTAVSHPTGSPINGTTNLIFPVMYSQCGQDNFYVDLGNGDFLLEQGAFPCHFQNPTPSTCFQYPSNVWVTFYFKVQIGTWGQPNSSIQAWLSLNGQPYQQYVNMPNHTLFQDTGEPGYDMVSLVPYWSFRDPAISDGPTSYTWYDELIVSTQPIAAPNN
jgi:hypothetical protein